MASAGQFFTLSDDQKEKLHQLIVDGLQFPDVKEDCLCSSCQIVPIFHKSYPCQHIYCSDCYTFFCSKKKRCSKCKTDIKAESSQNKVFQNKIYSLKAVCPNRMYGCSEEMELNKLLLHIEKNCQFTKTRPEISCHDNTTCKEAVSEPSEFITILNSMQTTMQNIEKDNREANEGTKIDLDHLNQSVLNKLDEKLESFKAEIFSKMKENVTKRDATFKIREMDNMKQGTVLFEVNNYHWKKKERATVHSDPFYSSENCYKMRLSLIFDSLGLHPRVEFLPGEFDRFLAPGFYHRTTFTILDQSDGMEKRHITRVEEPSFGTEAIPWMKKEKGPMIPYDLLEKSTNDVYLENDVIYVRVLVMPLQLAFAEYFSRDGILAWTIDGYTRTVQDAISGIKDKYVRSDYFYSSAQGYRMQSLADFSVSGRVTFHLRFLVGEFDSTLPSVFPHQCTWFVVNQRVTSGRADQLLQTVTLNTANELDAKRKMTSKKCLSSTGIAISNVEKEAFLVNNRIVIRVVVKKR